MTRWYLSGPMSGYPQHNAPQFQIAAAMLRERGYDVCNPVEFDEAAGLPWSDYLRKDIRALMDCHGVITLHGWQESRGASLEVHIAHALGMQVLPFSLAVTMAGDQGRHATVGDKTLLPQQIAVLQGFADGETATQIARRIKRSENAVHAIAGRATRLLGAHDRTHAVAAALRKELIE